MDMDLGICYGWEVAKYLCAAPSAKGNYNIAIRDCKNKIDLPFARSAWACVSIAFYWWNLTRRALQFVDTNREQQNSKHTLLANESNDPFNVFCSKLHLSC